jgi:hypothetical protein
VLATGRPSLFEHTYLGNTKFAAFMALSFITFFYIFLVLFCIVLYMVVSFACFCLIL